MTPAELSRKSGIAHPLISGYLNKSSKGKFPSFEKLLALAKALNCTLEEITGLSYLKDVEKDAEQVDMKKLSETELLIIEEYNKLPDGDPRKEAIDALLLKGKRK